MCKHEQTLTTARNAVIAVRAGLRGSTVSPSFNGVLNEELSRLENFYDYTRFEYDVEETTLYFCSLCEEQEDELFSTITPEEFYALELWGQELMRESIFSKWVSSLYSASLVWGK